MSFSNMASQKGVAQLLQRSLDAGRLSHAYLFAGHSQSDLEEAGRTLAKTLNCSTPSLRGASGRALDCCDVCPSCSKIDQETHPDIVWVRPESKSRIITIEQIRDLMQGIYLKPREAQTKVALISGADRLNIQAANAFLKTLEEPPPQSILLLLSTEPQRLLETLVSRCLRLNFSGESLSSQHQSHADWLDPFSAMAAEKSQSLLDRYRLLGLLLNKLAGLKAAAETSLTAKSPLERHPDIEPKLREKWEDELNAAIEAEYRRLRADLLVGLQWWLRDVWLQTLALGQTLLSFPALASHTLAIASRLSIADAVENLRVLEQAQRLLASNVQEALALEVSLLKLKL